MSKIMEYLLYIKQNYIIDDEQYKELNKIIKEVKNNENKR